VQTTPPNYDDCLRQIRFSWAKLTSTNKRDRQLRLGVPYPYVCPNTEIFADDLFYWDSYFTILGLVVDGKTALAKGMVENFIALHRRFRIMPMRNKYYNLGTSQIPFFTSMVFEVYEHKRNKAWLKKCITTAEENLAGYWMNERLTEKHLVYKGLSRYCDHYITHLGAEHESGWDMTSRFGDKCLEYLPIDLNCCLYKYETDLARAYKLLGERHRSKKFKLQARQRKAMVNALMWDKKRKFFFDYNYVKKHVSHFYSVAGFYPLWCGLASKKQAAAIVEFVLPIFEYEGGIANTQSYGLASDFRQHDFPNGWPPHHWIVVKGLLDYGYKADAQRIARKWLDMNQRLFQRTGHFWEKHDVTTCEAGRFNPDRYVTQTGFAWTNAVFLRIAHEFGWHVKSPLKKRKTESELA
jgi:alpha,alpha-trehalase